MNYLALDIGGANLKVADGRGYAAARFFPLWKRPRELAQELRTLIAESPPSDHLLVTMSGELADCFATKADGVRFILEAVSEAADRRHTRIYRNDGKMVAPQVAAREPLLAAAANWHALARFAGRYAPQGVGLLIDVGSTTCDLVPLHGGEVAARGHSDTERMIHHELVYTGVERSPACALARSTRYRGQECLLAHEVFSTTRDVYLILGHLAEDPSATNTADGRPATKHHARARLARQICAGEEDFNHKDAVQMAQMLADAQLLHVAESAARLEARLPGPPQTIVIAGEGEFFARRLIERMRWTGRVVSLMQELGPHVSLCAPAHALAVLAYEAAGQ